MRKVFHTISKSKKIVDHKENEKNSKQKHSPSLETKKKYHTNKRLLSKPSSKKRMQTSNNLGPKLKFTYSKHKLVKNGDLRTIESNFDHESINSTDVNGLKPIHVAFLSGKKPHKTVKLLHNLGAQLDSLTTNGESVLHLLCKSKKKDIEALKYLLTNNLDVNLQNNQGQTPLSYLCEDTKSKVNFLRMLLEAGANPNITRDDGCSPLLLACRSNLSIKVIQLLINYRADANLKSKKGDLALHQVLTKKTMKKNQKKKKPDPKIVRLLLEEAHALANLTDPQGLSALHLACRDCSDQPQMIELLLAHESKINQLSESGYAPIHFFCKSHNIDPQCLDILLSHKEKIDLNIKSTSKLHFGWMSIHFACDNEIINFSLIKKLFQNGANFDLAIEKSLLTPLHLLCKKKNKIENSEKIINLNSDDDDDDDDDDNENENENEIDLFFNSDLDPDIETDSDTDSGKGQLKEKNTNISTNTNTNTNSNNKTNTQSNSDLESDLNYNSDLESEFKLELDLEFEQSKNNSIIETIKFLIEVVGIKIESRDKYNKTPLSFLWERRVDSKSYEIELMKILLANGAKINQQHRDNLSLIEIVKKENQPIDRHQLSKAMLIGLDVNQCDDNGMAALHTACCSTMRHLGIIWELLNTNAKLNSFDNYNWTPLHFACKTNPNNRLVEMLVNQGALKNAVDRYNTTPIQVLTRQKKICIESIRFLIEYDADLSILDNYGNTPLISACAHPDPNFELIQLLIENSCDVNSKVTYGWLKGDTPLITCCKHSDNYDVIKLLLESGADPNQKDRFGNTPLHYIASREKLNIKTLELFLEFSAKLNIKEDLCGNTPIHFIAKNPNVDQEILFFLYNNDADFFTTNLHKKQTPFSLLTPKNVERFKKIQSKPKQSKIKLEQKKNNSNSQIKESFSLFQFLAEEPEDETVEEKPKPKPKPLKESFTLFQFLAEEPEETPTETTSPKKKKEFKTKFSNN
ncbi:ankyrin repeat-containing protein [Anaeramoeba flamelloides]|uniref:Ankyrin repeat-containing protein n=1 Tax=Anaeramoeba flamelloides TaxID=1746091 RepID=A0AAV7YEZ9_9EUKA|nr:ankyrin repeat-containing protein [Anaeramoeba flamelloides]